MRYYEGDSLQSDGRTWEVVFATASPKCGRILLLKSREEEWALATDNLDGTIRDLELI